MRSLLVVMLLLIAQLLHPQQDKLYPSPANELVRHTYYTLSYNEEHEQADWVFYLFTKKMPNSKYDRSGFKTDNLVNTGSAKSEDYNGFPYDRGHLCCAEDMSWNKKAITETFYMSNMSPQLAGFNRGIWKRLENKVKYWVKKNDSLYVVVGGILKPGLNKIGYENKVSVPDEFFKVIVCLKAQETKGIAFLFPHEKSDEHIFSYVISIDSLEEYTGIDFFAGLPQDIQAKFETTSSLTQWETVVETISIKRRK